MKYHSKIHFNYTKLFDVIEWSFWNSMINSANGKQLIDSMPEQKWNNFVLEISIYVILLFSYNL